MVLSVGAGYSDLLPADMGAEDRGFVAVKSATAAVAIASKQARGNSIRRGPIRTTGR